MNWRCIALNRVSLMSCGAASKAPFTPYIKMRSHFLSCACNVTGSQYTN